MSELFNDWNYEDDTHTYTNRTGVVRPSVTGTLKSAGLVDYSMVDPELLETKRVIGDNVHKWTAIHDKGGRPDPMSITSREMGFARAWLNFKRDMGLKIISVERPMLRTIRGLELGGTPDIVGIVARRPTIIDKKCCASTMPVWELQLADYEMMLTGAPYVGIYQRMSVRLREDGRYFPTIYSDVIAGEVAFSALQLAYDPEDKKARANVDAWAYNKRIKIF